METPIGQLLTRETGYASSQKRLANYLCGGRVHPALLLTCQNSQVLHQIALSSAKFLLCERKKKSLFCNECSVCRRIEKNIHPDVIILNQEDSGFKIEQIRKTCHQMEIAPLEGTAKVCVIEQADQIPKGAANALLKSLEEPKPSRYFLLLTHNFNALLPTILSRCLQFHFEPEKQESLVSDEELEQMSTVFRNFQQDRNLTTLKPVLESKEKGLEFLHYIMQTLRDNVCQNPSSDEQKLYGSIRAFEQATILETRLRSNANYGLMIENFMLQYF